jgi:hypothetical protein
MNKKPEPRWLVRHANSLIRAGAGIVGLGALVFAGYCTLKSDNEVGTAAAYVVGLYFSIIAITGRVPKLKMGDNELDPTSLAIGAAAGVAQVTEAAAEKAEHTDDAKEVVAATRDAGHDFLRVLGNVKFIGPTNSTWTLKDSDSRGRLLVPFGSPANSDWYKLFTESAAKMQRDNNPDDDPPDPVGAVPKA